MDRGEDQDAIHVGTYISKNGRFKSLVYDSREIRTIANNLGLKTDRVRSELRRLGYCLIMNNNGRMVWKRDGVSI
jgi:translation initiation factor 6 (eIF-6)